MPHLIIKDFDFKKVDKLSVIWKNQYIESALSNFTEI